MQPEGKALMRQLLNDPATTGGFIAQSLRLATGESVDHLAVDHFRRKMRAGKARL